MSQPDQNPGKPLLQLTDEDLDQRAALFRGRLYFDRQQARDAEALEARHRAQLASPPTKNK